MKFTALLTALAAFLGAGAAHAHGDAAHGKTKTKAIDVAAWPESAYGRPALDKQAQRTVRISMTDRMRFVPDRIEIKRGETVRLIVSNDGKAMHEVVIGTEQELREHAELMMKFPDMEHDAPNMAHVAPGRRENIAWEFTQRGEFRFACLMPGHYQAGMVGTIVVR